MYLHSVYVINSYFHFCKISCLWNGFVELNLQFWDIPFAEDYGKPPGRIYGVFYINSTNLCRTETAYVALICNIATRTCLMFQLMAKYYRFGPWRINRNPKLRRGSWYVDNDRGGWGKSSTTVIIFLLGIHDAMPVMSPVGLYLAMLIYPLHTEFYSGVFHFFNFANIACDRVCLSFPFVLFKFLFDPVAPNLKWSIQKRTKRERHGR